LTSTCVIPIDSSTYVLVVTQLFLARISSSSWAGGPHEAKAIALIQTIRDVEVSGWVGKGAMQLFVLMRSYDLQINHFEASVLFCFHFMKFFLFFFFV